MANITTVSDEALIALDHLGSLAGNLLDPSIRLGVTGLSRAGKTVFITSFVHNMLHGGRMPMFVAMDSGRLHSAVLKPQPSMALPRFQYEQHVQTLAESRQWPNSTRSVSELRLTVEYESASLWNRTFGRGRLNIDIVDYPGEWLLDLPLLGLTFEQWSEQALTMALRGTRAGLSAQWRGLIDTIDAQAPADEAVARQLAEAFTAYLRACRQDDHALSTLPPGRFLMPGDLEGSPALTFSPLPATDAKSVSDSLRDMMRKRYEAYKNVVVRPFFREHFARLNRQIVLVDVLHAVNAGPEAIADLENALGDVLECFRAGGGFLSGLFGSRIDRILFAATKADHLHHENHDRLERLLETLVGRAAKKAQFAGARTQAMAMAAVRATREATVKQGGDALPVIVGVPMQGETIGKERFDGHTETAIFPGDLPADPARLLRKDAEPANLRFVRFRPPELVPTADGLRMTIPHIRLDRALDFLLGDWLA